MIRNQSKFPRIFLDALWELHAQRNRSLDELGAALGMTGSRLRLVFTKMGYSTWTEAELRSLHAEHLQGAFVSALASKRRKRSADLIAAWKSIGLSPLSRNHKEPQTRLNALVAQMHAEHLAGASLGELGRKYSRHGSSIKALFLKRGLTYIHNSRHCQRLRPDGTFQPFTPMSEEAITALVESAVKIAVPEELKLDWRHWNLEKRGQFIARLRARLDDHTARPTGPFSPGLIPFDYASEEAWEIVRKINEGRSSLYWESKINIRSQGVIFQGQLWFWNWHGRGYFRAGGWTTENGKLSLHRHIWSLSNGPVPEGFVVSIKDGNFNNLDPSNLALLSRNDICRSNQAAAMHRESIAQTNLILARSKLQPSEKNALIDHLRNPR